MLGDAVTVTHIQGETGDRSGDESDEHGCLFADVRISEQADRHARRNEGEQQERGADAMDPGMIRPGDDQACTCQHSSSRSSKADPLYARHLRPEVHNKQQASDHQKDRSYESEYLKDGCRTLRRRPVFVLAYRRRLIQSREPFVDPLVQVTDLNRHLPPPEGRLSYHRLAARPVRPPP